MRKITWLTGALILTMPISLIFFLGSQMAYGQVQRRYETYAAIPQITSVAELQAQTPGATVLLHGEITAPTNASVETAAPLLIYQERPRDGREVRHLEKFPLVLPDFSLKLSDGIVSIQPSTESATISHELHSTAIDDRELTGFQVGDLVAVQGKWQVAADAQSAPRLVDVTGVSSADGAALLAEVQAGMQKVRLARDGLGLLTLVSIVLPAVQLYRQRKSGSVDREGNQEENEEWRQTTETALTM